jgi:YVTN family beta-propeller protein
MSGLMARCVSFALCAALAMGVAGCAGRSAVAASDSASADAGFARSRTLVPDVAGLSLEDATLQINDAELIVGTVTQEQSTETTTGLMARQSPAAGESVTQGTAIDLVVSLGPPLAPTDTVPMVLVHKFAGPAYSPKSVSATQHGLVFAQNMMYRHTVSVFDASTYAPVTNISDAVRLGDFGHTEYSGTVKGGPVEAAATPDGKYVYVSNYSMYGPGFSHPGDDEGGPGTGIDPSFVYRISTETFEIDQVIKVGSVPKYLAVTPDGRYVLVSNWISYTVSIIDTAQGTVVKEISLGRYPRGIAVDSASQTAYVAIMGSNRIARINLADFSVSWIENVGVTPRHIVLSPDDSVLYASLNLPGKIVKIDLTTGKVVGSVATGTQPRSMAIAEDGRSLYVVNYESNSVSKVRTSDMAEIQELKVGHHPIGVTYVNAERDIWVCCYEGTFWIFNDPEQAE